jgi:hypothetical protein
MNAEMKRQLSIIQLGNKTPRKSRSPDSLIIFSQLYSAPHNR